MPRRSDARRFVAMLIITAATSSRRAHPAPAGFMTANDISRWCTVWSLLERGTYAIDECPWQVDTQDKVERPPKRRGGAAPGWQPDVKHFYSSKPALISTMIAGMLYPARRITGVPLDQVVLQERAERWTQKPDPDHPGKLIGVLEKPKEPGQVAGLYLLLQAGPDRAATSSRSGSSWSSSPGCSTATRPTTGPGSSA